MKTDQAKQRDGKQRCITRVRVIDPAAHQYRIRQAEELIRAFNEGRSLATLLSDKRGTIKGKATK
jgi:hypothetical protein